MFHVQSNLFNTDTKGTEQVSALQRCPYYRDVRKERLDCICFLNKFLLADFLTFSGKAFLSRMPNQENEFFSCSRREDMT